MMVMSTIYELYDTERCGEFFRLPQMAHKNAT